MLPSGQKMFVFGYLRASTSEQDASRAKNALKAFANQHNAMLLAGISIMSPVRQ
jgi:hypothetical protein